MTKDFQQQETLSPATSPSKFNFNDQSKSKSVLESLESAEQRALLNVVADMRKCGLEGIISLPQIVVCGDQSSGKSSVLEALTEIPFPRNDNLCTRYATEISIRRGSVDSLMIKIIPDSKRTEEEQKKLKDFKQTITDFSKLPDIMNLAAAAMGIGTSEGSTSRAAFARDVLSVEIEGPCRPQLTVIDIPGLVQSETDGVTKADLLVVEQITDSYIKQPRTINLAVISASSDYACQQIITKVREVDPTGSRTLGVITKPDKLDSGSDSEKAYIKLARNEDVKFALGWHVVKNRSYKDRECSLEVRNATEAEFFDESNFCVLPQEHLGIDNLRLRLGDLLYAHLRREIPNLRKDLDAALDEAKASLLSLGPARSSGSECKRYLTRLSMNFLDFCKAAINGAYEGTYFKMKHDQNAQDCTLINPRRLRAVIQASNTNFTADFLLKGHKFHFGFLDADQVSVQGQPTENASEDYYDSGLWRQEDSETTDGVDEKDEDEDQGISDLPEVLDRTATMRWIGNALAATRGRELGGNYNPLIIGELFWFQSSKWQNLATSHLEAVSHTCRKFLHDLLTHVCPEDLVGRIWSHKFLDNLDARHEAAEKELSMILEDLQSYPTSYTHQYSDAVRELRQKRVTEQTSDLANEIERNHSKQRPQGALKNVSMTCVQPKMKDDELSHTDILDCLLSIYKVTPHSRFSSVTKIL